MRIRLVLLISVFLSSSAFVSEAKAATYLDLFGESAILAEQNTGKVLYSKNENKRMYPASMTKILTALVALDYLDADELVEVGNEIKNVPYGSSLAYHIIGENITVRNLIRGLIIPSGNDTGNVVAMAVAKKVSNQPNINYNDAERLFGDLMNAKAKSLGALNSNFVNPHGYHDDNHYTTAQDLLLIAIEAMNNDLISAIAKERYFGGNGAGENPSPSLSTQSYKWTTHNNLLLPNEPNYYPYATGIKTGLTNEAGHCLAASAEKDSKQLIAIVFKSTEIGRLEDCIKLFDYGFNFFDYAYMQKESEVLEKIPIAGGKLGESDALDIVAAEEYKGFFSKDEVNNIKRVIDYNDEYIDKSKPDSVFVRLKAPIEQGAELGTVKYMLNGSEIFTSSILSSRNVEKRTIMSDINYYAEIVKETAFNINAIPYWAGGIAILAVIIIIFTSVRRRRQRDYYRLRRRY